MPLKLAVIGCGVKASQYIESWIHREDVELIAINDVSNTAMQHIANLCEKQGLPTPNCYEDWQTLLEEERDTADAVYICTPHAFHAEQAIKALASYDVLLEKPMVTSVAEAKATIDAKNASGHTLVIAYQGGLSPLTHQLSEDVAKGSYGELISINACIWEDWAKKYEGHWKQNIEISGGGFMFDSGAHLMNTVSMICDSEFDTISALMDNRNQPVDVVTTAIGKLKNDTLFTLHASGESIPQCKSRIELFFSDAIVHLCAWGRWIEIENKNGDTQRIEQESVHNLLDIFLDVKAGKMPNPSPAEQGLKMAYLWDAIKDSARKNGQPVIC